MASYGALWRARIDMMRPGNGAMVMVAVLIGAALTSGWQGLLDALRGQGDLRLWLAAPLAAFFIAGFGNVLNDIVDRSIDAQAHPERPLPSGRIGLADAKAFAILLLGFGLLEAYIAAGVALAGFALANAALLALYEVRLKALPGIGNVTIALLVASAFAFGSVAAGGRPGHWDALWWIMGMVALTNMAREILKDIEDQDADAGRRTLPMAIGADAAGWVATGAIGIAVGLDAALVWQETAWHPVGRAALALSGCAFVVAAGMGCHRAALGQRGLKAAMLLALLGLALAASHQ